MPCQASELRQQIKAARLEQHRIAVLAKPGKCAYAAPFALLSFCQYVAILFLVVPALPEDFVLSHSDPATGLPVGPRAVHPNGDYTAEDLLAVILASVDDDKAENVVQIDLRGRSDVADYMVICSGRSTRQVASISEKLADRLKQDFRMVAKMEGKETGDWVLIDTGDVIVHVFRPEVREFYDLEKMWLPGSTHRGA